MPDSSDHSLSRATLWAALIGGACAIIAAIIGVSVGHRSANERVQGLQQDVQSRDQSLDSMKSELEKRDAQISALKASMEEQQRQSNEMKQELASLKGGSGPTPGGSAGDGGVRTSGGVGPVSPPPERSGQPTLQKVEQGDFNFELRGCTRRGGLVRCSLAVTNVSENSKQINLCGASYLIDEAGRKPETRIQFDGGSCGVFGLEPNLPRAFQMSASIPADANRLSVVLSDGNWFSFPGSAIFRDVPIISQ